MTFLKKREKSVSVSLVKNKTKLYIPRNRNKLFDTNIGFLNQHNLNNFIKNKINLSKED